MIQCCLALKYAFVFYTSKCQTTLVLVDTRKFCDVEQNFFMSLLLSSSVNFGLIEGICEKKILIVIFLSIFWFYCAIRLEIFLIWYWAEKQSERIWYLFFFDSTILSENFSNKNLFLKKIFDTWYFWSERICRVYCLVLIFFF